eukprot:9200685-Alexandrium_andersonii.AAC.1
MAASSTTRRLSRGSASGWCFSASVHGGRHLPRVLHGCIMTLQGCRGAMLPERHPLRQDSMRACEFGKVWILMVCWAALPLWRPRSRRRSSAS